MCVSGFYAVHFFMYSGVSLIPFRKAQIISNIFINNRIIKLYLKATTAINTIGIKARHKYFICLANGL